MRANKLFVMVVVSLALLFPMQGSAKKPVPGPELLQPVVVDSNGEIIGTMIYRTESGTSLSGEFTAAAIGFSGNGHPYYMNVVKSGWSLIIGVIYDDPFCSGNAFITANADNLLPKGAISNNTAYAPDASNPPVSVEVFSIHDVYSSDCHTFTNSFVGDFWPAIPDIDISQYLPPFRVILMSP